MVRYRMARLSGCKLSSMISQRPFLKGIGRRVKENGAWWLTLASTKNIHSYMCKTHISTVKIEIMNWIKTKQNLSQVNNEFIVYICHICYLMVRYIYAISIYEIVNLIVMPLYYSVWSYSCINHCDGLKENGPQWKWHY